MTKLDELIQEYCPDGVEFRKLGEISQYCKERIDASTVDKTCYVGVENLLQNKQGKTLSSAVPTTGQVIAFSFGDILIGNIRPYLKKIWLADCNGGTNGDVLAIHITDSGMLPEFLYYVLSSDSFFHYDMQYAKGSKMPRGSKEAVLQYITPVPPLPVQREIVRILDNFTELTEGLYRELAAELTARKKQYAYYRDKLLTFGDVQVGVTSDVIWRALGEICDVRDGTHDSPKPTPTGKYLITSKNVKNGTIDYTGAYLISDKDYEQINVRSKVDTWDILFTMIGTIGEIGVVAYESDFAIKNVGLIKTGNELLSRFLRHYLVSDKVKAYIDANRSKGTQAFLALGKLRELPVPVVSEPAMKKLVQVLDNFDAICTDLSSGLPAEIEARQKQYEYYRDKLLSFEEKI